MPRSIESGLNAPLDYHRLAQVLRAPVQAFLADVPADSGIYSLLMQALSPDLCVKRLVTTCMANVGLRRNP
jgi:hypothetical protein